VVGAFGHLHAQLFQAGAVRDTVDQGLRKPGQRHLVGVRGGGKLAMRRR